MKKIIVSGEFFNIKDTLECGQVFRFKPYKQGFLAFTLDKCCYCYNQGDSVVIECEDSDEDYFYNYFDLQRDYSLIVNDAISEGVEILTLSANCGRGIRILNQDCVETLISFIISQNNNIPRIKSLIEKLCFKLGEKKYFLGEEYYAFPSVQAMASKSVEFYNDLGFGYRSEYVRQMSVKIANGYDIYSKNKLNTVQLKEELLKNYGVGNKVCDCVLFFGFHRSDSFPVDTWIEKVYIEDFKGELKNREKISSYLVERFKQNSGYYQQYLFHYKRMKEKWQKDKKSD